MSGRRDLVRRPAAETRRKRVRALVGRDLTDADPSSEVAAAWHDVLVADPPLVAEWRGALRTVRARLDDGAHSVTFLWVGADCRVERRVRAVGTTIRVAGSLPD